MSSKISWTDETWNPVVGCSKVSPGCANCYAEKMACRLAAMGNANYEVVISPLDWKWIGKAYCIESALTKPLHWKKPRKIFVCSMGDLFHESVPFEFIDKVFAVMALCPQHTFQVLTKRAERMAEYIKQHYGQVDAKEYLVYTDKAPITKTRIVPLDNVWLGVTVEDGERRDRIKHLLSCSAAKRFLSIEPMISEVSLRWLAAWKIDSRMMATKPRPSSTDELDGLRELDLIICGGETGPGARPMELDWARSLRDQCDVAGVPFHFKNVGGVRKPKDGHLLDGVEHRPEML